MNLHFNTKLNLSKFLLILGICFNFINASNDTAQDNSDIVSIEINSGKTKIATFAVECNDPNLGSAISNRLILTSRFAKADENSCDLRIKITYANIQAKVEIFDILQKKNLKSFNVTCVDKKELTNEIANQIYITWLNEPGLFKSTLIFARAINSNLKILSSLEFSENCAKDISSPISYLSDLLPVNNSIFITKFCVKSRGFAIFNYDRYKKRFGKIISIKNGSVFSPFVIDNTLYVSASNKGTTGIFSIENPLHTHRFSSYENFEKNLTEIIKVPKKIATSLAINEIGSVFCANFNGTPSLFYSSSKKISIASNKKISTNGAYYDPTLFGSSIAAIKIFEKKFHLIVFNLQTKTENILFSKYHIGKPCWSPCGKWLCVSFREKGENNKIALIHKSGRYVRVISSSENLTNPIWVNS